MNWFRTSTATPPGRRFFDRIKDVRQCAQELSEVTDEKLASRAAHLRERLAGQSLNSRMFRQLQTEAFALITAAMVRTTGRTYYDVQLLAGMVLTTGAIAEMQTGEGKTITTALPVFVLALFGRGVHVATTNAYLAERDCAEVRPALELLGLTVGFLPVEHDPVEKQQAYACDVTYGTGYEFGFDFLRDQIALRSQSTGLPGVDHLRALRGLARPKPQQLQREHAFAIIDESDSVLIDEATMPLILSSQREDPAADHLLQLARDTADMLEEDEHFEIDRPARSLRLTRSGIARAHAPLYDGQVRGLRRPWATYIENALRGKYFFHRDVDYVVRDGAVQIVDQNTGRIHEERSWRDGLHQAVELLEGVEVSPEKDSDGRVSRQRYFQFYDQICGLTGTASGNEGEFRSFYDLPVIVIPTHRPSQRSVLPTRCFSTDEDRNQAIVEDCLQRSRGGQPVLIGTRTIAHSHRLHEMLHNAGASHRVLNGVQDEEEAHIVGEAGRSGAITIATNMAGRGTDIKPDADAMQAGGLHVIAAEHNFSPRVDRQLSGRAARQGNPGSAQFFVSADDELFVISRSVLPEDIRRTSVNGESSLQLDEPIRRLQTQLEAEAFERRQDMFRRDQWMDSVMKTLVGTAG